MIIVLIGPTCTGKSESAIKVATLFNAEIVNGDAFQVYKEMNIGVAKPTEEDFKKVPHHLYSCVSIEQPFSIKEYQTALREAIKDIQGRGKNVVIVGGSGLYIRAGLYDYEFNDEVEEIDMSEYENMTNTALHSLLKEIDPEDAIKIHENNRKRVMRAIEIYLRTGMNKSKIIATQKHEPIYDDCYFFTREISRDELALKISKRVDYMALNGLYEEVKDLYETYGIDNQAMQAIGYKEFGALFRKEKELDEVLSEIKFNTRKYAKRQETFIRHQFNVEYYKNDDELIELISNKE